MRSYGCWNSHIADSYSAGDLTMPSLEGHSDLIGIPADRTDAAQQCATVVESELR